MGALSPLRLTIIAVDMPVSRSRIESRRPSDNQISKAFGGRGCSTHTPSRMRPGKVGESLSHACEAAGYDIATVSTGSGTRGRLIEVYPHPALLLYSMPTIAFPTR